MWKESLRIGIDSIDEQHKALFDKIEELRKELHDDNEHRKQNCIDAISFLKDYTVRHFADEEAYQQSIEYEFYPVHKKLHEAFVKTLNEHEKKLKASDYSDTDVSTFVGMLMTWLLYHVADCDQKIGKDFGETEFMSENHDMVLYSLRDVLGKMAGYNAKEIDAAGIEDTQDSGEKISIELSISGGASGYTIYTFPFAFVKDLMNTIMGYDPKVLGELEISTLFELSNIISGTVCRQISFSRKTTCEVSSPYLAERSGLLPGNKIAVDTGKGIVEAEVLITYGE